MTASPRVKVLEPTTDIVLSFNADSSALKFALFRFDARGEHLLASGSISQVATPRARARLDADFSHIERSRPVASFAEAIIAALDLLSEGGLPVPAVVGHCIAYGGDTLVVPSRVDSPLVSTLKQLMSFTPVQLASQIVVLEAALRLLPGVPHIACFDSAFHAMRHAQLARYALPSDASSKSPRPYGAHGLSFELVMSSLGAFPPNRVIIAHLDGDTSLVAVREGRSIETSATFTLPDALRPDFEGESSDRPTGGHVAALTFGYTVRKMIGAYFAALGGLDLLVFTGRIGERSAQVRQECCSNLCALGIDLDGAKNARNDCNINAGPVAVQIVAADEQRMIALHARAALHAGFDGNIRGADGSLTRFGSTGT